MVYVGFDVGGTNIKCGISDENGNLKYYKKSKILEAKTDHDFLNQFVKLIHACFTELSLDLKELAGIGIAVPGAVDIRKGKILYCCNLPFKDIPIRSYLHKIFKCPVLIENDANCAALAEYYFGSGKGSKRFITVTLGTGVGGGIIHNGKIFHGGNGFAGEVGHMTIVHNGLPCACGNCGCWEQYSSAPALKRMTKQAMDLHPDSILCNVVAQNDGHISGQSAFIASRLNDPVAKEVCQMYLEYLSTGILNLVNIFQPDVIALGGGVSNENDEQLLFPLRKMVNARTMPVRLSANTKIVRANLGNDAGMIGAALLVLKKRV